MASELVQNIVISTLGHLCGPNTEISLDTNIAKDLPINSDDLSFDFIPVVEAELNIDVPQSEWYKVNTVREVCELLEAHYQKARKGE